MTLEQIKADARTIRKTSARLWYEANHELVKQRSKQHKQENPQRVKLQNEQYRLENRPILNTKNRIRTRKKKIIEFQQRHALHSVDVDFLSLSANRCQCEANIKQLVSDNESDAKLLSELQMAKKKEKLKTVAAENKTADETGELAKPFDQAEDPEDFASKCLRLDNDC